MKAFVFGKFYPLHKGHIALIDYARQQCDELTILICCSDKELISAETREAWLRSLYATDSAISIRLFNYQESDLPNTSVASRDVSRVWSEQFKRLLPDVDVVVTSEPYGEYVAEYMGIQHICFDELRQLVPISATQIRQDLVSYWSYLPEPVRQYFQRTVVIAGTESVGKSTLARQLADSHQAELVAEVGRSLVPQSTDVTLHDLYQITEQHAAAIEHARQNLSSLIIVDTDVYITQSYAKFMFGHYLELDETIYRANQADLRLYLSADVPFVQDGTRLAEQARNQLDQSHRQTLADFKQDYQLISGNWSERYAASCQAIGDHFKQIV